MKLRILKILPQFRVDTLILRVICLILIQTQRQLRLILMTLWLLLKNMMSNFRLLMIVGSCERVFFSLNLKLVLNLTIMCMLFWSFLVWFWFYCWFWLGCCSVVWEMKMHWKKRSLNHWNLEKQWQILMIEKRCHFID